MQSQKENLAPIGDAAANDFVGRLYGAWVVAAVDAFGRRATVVCKCGVARQVSVDALWSGESVGCGCRLTRHRPGYLQADRDAFPSAVAKQESRSSWKRHRGGGREE
jgi:hypothetical protein